jgi:MoaA/NifB/PqqE/SkfB family radical SAM enzyme
MNNETFVTKKFLAMPRLPLEGHIDLTYRCNNSCRHCWLKIPANAPEKKDELSFDEIRCIVDDARKMGCRKWGISGGEPMLRPDFHDIFDYVTKKSIGYTLNTNGTLITPEIARLLTRKGTKMIALYGADSKVYEDVTGNPSGFEQVMQGFSNLKEAGVGFMVQLIPMKANWHQWERMVELAKRLSKHWRIGAPWLYLSSCGSPERNRQIESQRLDPEDVIELDKPNPSYEERLDEMQTGEAIEPSCGFVARGDDRLFARCIEGRRDFHLDPYGTISWCSFIKDPSLRYNLRKGSFSEAWENFIPSCADKVHGGDEWMKNCGSCNKRSDCRWCAVYSYLETGRYSAPVPYLCSVAEEGRKFKEDWKENHRKYFQIAGITVRVESDLDMSKIKFKDELKTFEVTGPGEDNVTFRHYFELPDLTGKDLGIELYRKAPWAISKKNGAWFYRGISPTSGDLSLHRVAVFNESHTRATIYNRPGDEARIIKDGWQSLSHFPTDQIWLGPLLADRNAVLIHSAAAIVNGHGLVFVGHSEAGKSTTMEMLKTARKEDGLNTEILCDDRNVIRKWPDGWLVHGTWSHGTTADVSPSSAPLSVILFIKQDTVNSIDPLADKKAIWKSLLATLIRPMVTAEWWQKELDILERIVAEIPCFTMRFDKSGAIIDKIVEVARIKSS